MAELSKTYDPKATEERWYEFWLKGGYFHADERRDARDACPGVGLLFRRGQRPVHGR